MIHQGTLSTLHLQGLYEFVKVPNSVAHVIGCH